MSNNIGHKKKRGYLLHNNLSTFNVETWTFICFFFKIIIITLTNRFHAATRLFSDRLQMTSKFGTNKRVSQKAKLSVSPICVTDLQQHESSYFFFWLKSKISMRLTSNGSNERTNQTACMIQLIIKLKILTHRFWLDIKMYFWQLSSEMFRFAFQIDKLDYFCSHKLNGR